MEESSDEEKDEEEKDELEEDELESNDSPTPVGKNGKKSAKMHQPKGDYGTPWKVGRMAVVLRDDQRVSTVPQCKRSAAAQVVYEVCRMHRASTPDMCCSAARSRQSCDSAMRTVQP